MMSLEELVWQLDAAAKAGDGQEARALAGQLLARLQNGERLSADEGREAALALRDVRAFDLLESVAREIGNRGNAHPSVLRLLGQSLIEQGNIEEALGVLGKLRTSEARGSAEWAEASGLMGRALKDVVVGTRDKTSLPVREALAQSIEHYHEAYALDPSHVWQGLNVLALSSLAQRVAPELSPPVAPNTLAHAILTTLDKTPPEKRDRWYHASRAEALVALGRWDEVERHIG
jgi:tetratricopeptide (TPR) repeat protein